MAKLGWIGSVALATGAAAGAAAAQFGLGYGLGIISWSPEAATGSTTIDSVWLSSLAWTTWIAATSTVVGAIYADRRSAGEIGAAPPRTNPSALVEEPPTMIATGIWRTLLAVASAVGALISVALVLVPARVAVRPDTSTPELIAAGYAVVGIVVGILIAIGALAARAAANNAIATASWLWLLAIASVIDAVAIGRDLSTAPLAEWPFGDDTYLRSWSIPGAALMLGAAFVIGGSAAWSAARRGDKWVGPALSGGIGPLLVAVAYFFTAPNRVGLNDPQVSAYLVAPYAVLAGLAGSVLVIALVNQREPTAVRHLRQRQAADAAVEATPVRIPVSSVSKRGSKRGATSVPAQPTDATTTQVPASTPTGSTPTGSTPAVSTPTGSTPTGSTPTASTPTASARASVPAPSSSVTSTPTGRLPATGSPASSSSGSSSSSSTTSSKPTAGTPSQPAEDDQTIRIRPAQGGPRDKRGRR